MGQEWSVPGEAEAASEPTASAVLWGLAGRGEERISLGDLSAAVGSRVHGFALLLLVLPETIPLPLPSASTLLAIPLMLISLHLALFGEDSAWPGRLQDVHVRRSVVATTALYLAPALKWLETLSRPRWLALARRERLIGAVCFYLSLILFLPIPLMNAPPAISLAALALGLIQRDGIIIAMGMFGTVVTSAALASVLIWAADLIV